VYLPYVGLERLGDKHERLAFGFKDRLGWRHGHSPVELYSGAYFSKLCVYAHILREVSLRYLPSLKIGYGELTGPA
jgi:hypothetical protein